MALLALLAGCAGAPASPEGSQAPQVAVAKETKGSVDGFVTNDEIIPLVGATVELVGVVSQRTGIDGHFVFNDVEPGSYTVRAEAFGHEPRSESVRVAAGDVTPVRLALAPIPLNTYWTQRSVSTDALVGGAPTSLPLLPPTGLEEDVDKKTYAVEILGVTPQGEMALCTQIQVGLVPVSPTTLDLDLYLVDADGRILSKSASSWPTATTEHIQYTRNLAPQNLSVVVHVALGAATEHRIWINVTYATGLTAALLQYEDA